MAPTEMGTTAPAGDMQEEICADQEGAASVSASKNNNKRKSSSSPLPISSFETVNKSTITYKSDIKSKSKRNDHVCGILHYINKVSREDIHHTFVWLADKNDDDAVQNVIERLRDECDGDNNDDEMVFIPYSSLGNWISRYPHACEFLIVRCYMYVASRLRTSNNYLCPLYGTLPPPKCP